MRGFLGRAFTMLLKDLALEVRSRDMLAGALVFCLLTVLVLSFAIDPGEAKRSGAVGGLLWVTLLFSSALTLGKSVALERENGCIEMLLTTPGDRAAIFIGKATANACLVMVVAALVVPVFGILFQLDLWDRIPLLLCPIVLGAVAITGPGTLLGTMVMETRAREMLLPILLLPIQVPALIAVVEVTRAILSDVPLSDADVAIWVKLLLAFDLVFSTVAAALYDRLLEA